MEGDQPTPKTGGRRPSGTRWRADACTNRMSFEECELAVLRANVDVLAKEQGAEQAQSDDVKRMILLLESFLRAHNAETICYGGTAVNDELPADARFYDRAVDVPDYDFYAADNYQSIAKKLCDKYHAEGFAEVEAKAGVHPGTVKVYVQFTGIADITYLPPEIFRVLKKDSVLLGGIRYAPPDFLRMGMYLELSRPHGDVDRWEKVLKRLTLLNRHFPLRPQLNCNRVNFQRPTDVPPEEAAQLFKVTKEALVDENCVFFGGFAVANYARHLARSTRHLVPIPDFDVLSDQADRAAEVVVGRLKAAGIADARAVAVTEHPAVGEIVPRHLEIRVGRETVAMIFETNACHGYNTLPMPGHKSMRIATIDTMLTLYLAFMYSGKPYLHKDRILCMAKFLFDVQQANRLKQSGLLKRFGTKCLGTQPTLTQIRAEKAVKFRELKPGSKEYQKYFFKYAPAGRGTRRGKQRTVSEKRRERKIKRTRRRGFEFAFGGDV